MEVTLKIANINDAPNIALGWATAVVSIYGNQSISRPALDGIDKHLTLIIDDDDDNCPTIEPIQEYIDFLNTIENNDKLLIHSRNGCGRAAALAYIYFMSLELPPPQALYEVKQLISNCNPIIEIIKFAEEILDIGNKYSKFIEVWKKNN